MRTKLDEKLFVVSEDGALWERHWRADLNRWAWQDHGRPGNETIAHSPGAAMMNEKLFVVTALGKLWERHWRSDRGDWVWENHGTPPGTSAVSSPGAAMMDRKLFVAAANGHLFERYWNGAAWVWVDHGAPPGTSVQRVSDAPMSDARLFVTTAEGGLFERTWIGSAWKWVNHGSPPGTRVSTAPGAAMLDSKLFVGALGERLFERYWDGRVWTWVDHGTLGGPPIDLTRQGWDNWLSDFDFSGDCARPTNEYELVQVVEWAAKSGQRIRAIGSGHSHSKCARPAGVFVDMTAMSGAYDDVQWLKRNPSGLNAGKKLVRVRAGTRVKSLNRLILHTMRPALGLINAGTFDGQTIAGAISTGTHGTGMRLGSLADMVVSMDIVTVTRNSDGSPTIQMRRIEPTDGVTDPVAFRNARAEHGMVLEQDDRLFYSMVVGFGCMGIAFAYTLKVCDEYWLKEETECLDWPQLSSMLGTTNTVSGLGTVPELADSARHVWFIFNIAEMQGKNATDSPACFLIKRDIVPAKSEPPHWHGAWPPEREGDAWRELGQDLARLDPTKRHHGKGETIRNTLTRDCGTPSFKGGHWSSVSYIAHRREQDDRAPSEAPESPPPALSVEIAVPAMDIVAAVNGAVECVTRSEYFFVAPWGVCFSAPSDHYLSPAYGRPTAYLEVVFALPTPLIHPQKKMEAVRDEIAKGELARIEAALCYEGTLEGRPHLGKHNTLNRTRLANGFPRFDAWLATYRRFNALGTFDNAFTDQLGLTGER